MPPAPITYLHRRDAVSARVDDATALNAEASSRWTAETVAAEPDLEAVKRDVVAWQGRVIEALERVKAVDEPASALCARLAKESVERIVALLAAETVRRST
jgi:hypothetical protein